MKNDKATATRNSKLQEILKASGNQWGSVLTDSDITNNKLMTILDIPVMNVAFSGELSKGMTSGLTMIAGPSKHFKSGLMLYCISQYLKEHEDATAVIFDSEFGTPKSYFESNGIDTDRVVHLPITDVEQLKVQSMNVLASLKKGDKIIFGIDSIGNLASKKEVDDALDGKSVADMSRAKQIKSLFRMITPHLTLKDIPMLVINHTYKEIGLFPKDIVGGGTGSYYSSDTIWIVGRQQEKDKDNKVSGYNFVLNVEKSRYVKEKSKFILNVNFESGIYKYSGLLDMALDGNFIAKPANGWYQLIDQNTGEFIGDKKRESDTGELIQKILKDEKFQEYVRHTYQLKTVKAEATDEVTESDDE